jgi:hypothetical protein
VGTNKSAQVLQASFEAGIYILRAAMSAASLPSLVDDFASIFIRFKSFFGRADFTVPWE